MRDRHGLLRLHRFRTEECRRQVADIEMMVADLMRKYDELDAHVKYEEGRNGITDPAKREAIGEDRITLYQRHARGELCQTEKSRTHHEREPP